MKQDRFLTGILIFIGVLVVAAVALFFVRSRAPAYGPDDTPQGVVYNYATALQLHDYARAYNYLAQKPNRPTYESFQQAFLTYQANPSNAALQVGDVQTLPDGETWVSLSIQYAGGGLFSRDYSATDKAVLVDQNRAWKLTYMPYPYWGFDWYQVIPTPAK